MRNPTKGVMLSERSDWLTPQWILDGVRQVFTGDIDLDPCSDERNNTRALKIYTKKHDGLSKPWYGRVFMNPPYSRDKKILRSWSAKWKEEFDRKHMTVGIALVAARADTDWWENLYSTADAACFIHHRVHFDLPNKKDSTPSTFPSVLIFATNEPDKYRIENFIRVFESCGNVWIHAAHFFDPNKVIKYGK